MTPTVGRMEDYKNARQLAAYAGLTPCERSSGTSVHGKTRLSCTGNVRLPKPLYMPEVVAMRRCRTGVGLCQKCEI